MVALSLEQDEVSDQTVSSWQQNSALDMEIAELVYVVFCWSGSVFSSLTRDQILEVWFVHFCNPKSWFGFGFPRK